MRRPGTKPPLLGVAIVVVAAGCLNPFDVSFGDGGKGVSGTWDGRFTVEGGTQDSVGATFLGSMTLVREDGTVTGTYTTSRGGSGQISATVDGGELALTFAQQNPCSGTYSGSAEVTSGSMSGGFAGSDCRGSLEVRFTASRR